MTTPNFKDFVAADVAATFLNLDEFAEIHSVYGVDMPAVVDRDTLRQAAQSLALDSYSENVMLYVSYEAMVNINRVPLSGNELKLDGVRYRVMTANLDNGMLEIALERADSL